MRKLLLSLFRKAESDSARFGRGKLTRATGPKCYLSIVAVAAQSDAGNT